MAQEDVVLERTSGTAAAEGVRHGWRLPRANEPVPVLDLEARWPESAEMAAFLADAAALNRRLSSRKSWVSNEVALRLQGAVNAARATGTGNATQNMLVAQNTLLKAQAVYLDDLQAKNRVLYLLGLVMGVGLMVLLPLVLLWTMSVAGLALQGSQNRVQVTLSNTMEWFAGAAPLTTTAPLFFFAGLGACASVLSRLTTIDLKSESSRIMVLLSAAIRPALAVIFACVVFVILQNKIISVGTDTVPTALIWVAAFLCGYSERFATDMLERVPLGNPQGNGLVATVPVATAVVAAAPVPAPAADAGDADATPPPARNG
jgi:hypothetical protein